MLSEKLGKVLTDSGMKQADFAASIGMDVDRFKNTLQKKVVNLRKPELDAIAVRYGVDPEWLTGKSRTKMLSDDKWQFLKNLNALSTATESALALSQDPRQQQALQTEFFQASLAKQPSIQDYVFVPRYEVQASAGGGSIIHDESVVDHLAFRRDWITQHLCLSTQHLALITIKGDSMAKQINDGDMVLLDTRAGQQLSDGVYVINLRGALLCKRLHLKISGTVEVISDNEKYAKEVVGAEEAGRLNIVGRVVWHGHRI